MIDQLQALVIGDAMIPEYVFTQAWEKHLASYGSAQSGNWEPDDKQLQYRRLEVEKAGPEQETVEQLPLIQKAGGQANVLLGLFLPVSSKVMDALPQLRIIGVCRSGYDNVNVAEATKRGILVFRTLGRNSQAVSDFTVGLILSEARNIARAHHVIKTGDWTKKFHNHGFVPELGGKNIGLIGFGYIGRLVAQKLSGFDVNVLVADPYVSQDDMPANCRKVELDELLSKSDFISIHVKDTRETKGLIGKVEFAKMKPTAYLINTGRAAVVDQDALLHALKSGQIMGAALDVFDVEPIANNSPFLDLDNVTLTTHIAGTTADVLDNSPGLLMADIAKLLEGKEPQFIVNPEVLENPEFRKWLDTISANSASQDSADASES